MDGGMTMEEGRPLTAAQHAGPPTAVGLRAWSTIALLSFLYFVSFVDRVILALLVQPLKADLGVTDLQLGLLFGPSFAIFYALVGLPLARVADRGDRKRLIVAGALVWGLCTVASGFTDSYLVLVLLRIGLAVGEAALTPAVYSLIGSQFPPHQRVRAASLYSATGIAGASAAYIVGAAVIGAVGVQPVQFGGFELKTWQSVFVIVGAPAVIGALLVALVAREPGRTEPAAEARLSRVWRHLVDHRALYVPLFCGAGIIQAANAAYAAWGPEFMRRELGLPIGEAGAAFGVAGLTGAVLGVLVVPAIGRALLARGRHGGVAAAAIAAAVFGGLAAGLGPLTGSPAAFLLAVGVAAFGLYGSSTGLVVAMQIIAPQAQRATQVSLLLLSITLLGQGLGPPAVALFASAGLGVALAGVSFAAAAIGAVLLWISGPPLARYLAR